MQRLVLAALAGAIANAASTDYSSNGANWGNDYPLCSSGTEQSPIDLTVEGASTSDSMEINGYGYRDFKIATSGTDLKREGGSVYVPMTDGEFHLQFADGSKSIFEPLQFHFHAPSEHSVDGNLYDLEVHFVHQYIDTDVELGAVIGVFFDRSAGNYDNDFLTEMFEDADSVNINAASFLSSINFNSYWNYPGSLTTPPCSEGIKWTVIQEVQPISDAQLRKFTEMWADNSDWANGNGNNRVVQPLKDRTLYFNGAQYGMAVAASLAAAATYLAF